jgi:hypothetical protein
MTIDPASRGFLGTAPARDPITGKVKVDKESITAFARRHGWNVKEIKGPDDYLTEVWCSKDGDRVNIWLWSRHNVSSATVNRIDLPSTNLQGRLESYLAGVPCSCDPDSDYNSRVHTYERHPDPACLVHGGIQARSWLRGDRIVETLPDPTEAAS